MPTDDHPVLYYDGNCGFCRRVVGWVRHQGADRFRYVPRVKAPADIQKCALTSVVLVDPLGQIYQGAKAVYKTQALLGHAFFWNLYQSNRVFSFCSEGSYSLISLSRPLLSSLLDVFLGPPPEDL